MLSDDWACIMALGTRNGNVDIASVAARLREARVDHADELAALAVTSRRVSPTPSWLDAIGIGESRFGGAPDVPASFEWPTRGGTPLSFLAQFDLSHFASTTLPTTGWLLFFYDAAEQPWGFDPSDAAGARVLYVDAPRDTLIRRHVIRAGDGFRPCSVSLSPVVDLPDLWEQRADPSQSQDR